MSDKAEARAEAFARRKLADRSVTEAANAHLVEAVRKARGKALSGYWPIRTELDPRPALHDLAETHEICLPVVDGPGQPLSFRRWTPETPMKAGAFGAMIPDTDQTMEPVILIVPLAAFDPSGYRLGYGGGFYDRTLERLCRKGPVTAIGFAYDIQMCQSVPREDTDQKLDLLVTESGVLTPL